MRKEITAYVLCYSYEDPVQEISDGNFFESLERCEQYIKENDPDGNHAWNIYSVKVWLEKNL